MMCKHDGGFDIVKTKNGEITDVICTDCGEPLMMIISEQQQQIEAMENCGNCRYVTNHKYCPDCVNDDGEFTRWELRTE